MLLRTLDYGLFVSYFFFLIKNTYTVPKMQILFSLWQLSWAQ